MKLQMFIVILYIIIVTCFDQNYWPVTYSLKWIIETVILSSFPLGADYIGLI